MIMNTKIIGMAALIAASTAMYAAAPSADAPEAPKHERREIRTLMSHEKEQPMELATFLGVITAPVSPELTTQLSLPECTGLLVMTIMQDSPASTALKRHDILLKLDDQILIETRQLAVLIRSKKAGDEVTFTLMRLGKQETVKVKLGKKEMPKLAMGPSSLPHLMEMPFPIIQGMASGEQCDVTISQRPGREDTDQVLRMLHGPQGSQVRIFDRKTGSAPHMAMLNPGRSTMMFNYDAGSIELTINDGKKSVLAKDNAGKEIFLGPINTPEEIKGMPEDLRTKLEKIETMDDFSFETDDDFVPSKPAVGPSGLRQISAPMPRMDRPSMPPAQRL